MFTTTCRNCGATFFKLGSRHRDGLCRDCFAAAARADDPEDAVISIGDTSMPTVTVSSQSGVTSMIRKISHAAMQLPEPFSSLAEDEKRHAAELMARFEALESQHGALPQSDLLRPMLLSKNGRYDEALALTAERYQQSPNWNMAVAAANAARRAGDIEGAAALFAKGAEHDPDDVTCWLEVGDIRLGQDRWADALAAYEKALARDGAQQWALPSAFYCRHRLGMDGNWLQSLREVADQEGCTCGLEGCLTAIFGGYGSEDGIARAEYLLSQVDDANENDRERQPRLRLHPGERPRH